MPKNSGQIAAVPRHYVLGMRLDYVQPDQFMDELVERAARSERGYVCSTDVHQCIRVHDDRRFREEVVNRADYVITDSFYLNLARHLLFGVPRTPLLTAGRMMPELCRRAALAGVPVGLVGGKSESVLQALKDNLARQYPNLDIAFAFSPPFREMTPEEDSELVDGLAKAQVRLLFVGLGCPKQENWMAGHRDRVSAMMIGVGAAFDFNAGVVKLSPPWVHKVGLEWLYRIVSEPRRLAARYAKTAPRFVGLVLMQAVADWSSPKRKPGRVR